MVFYLCKDLVKEVYCSIFLIVENWKLMLMIVEWLNFDTYLEEMFVIIKNIEVEVKKIFWYGKMVFRY